MTEHHTGEDRQAVDEQHTGDGATVPAGFELRYPPGEADDFIARLWGQIPGAPDGPLIGAVHQIGDRGQIVLRLSDPTVRQVLLLPGQVLIAPDPADSQTWTVTDGPPPYSWADRTRA